MVLHTFPVIPERLRLQLAPDGRFLGCFQESQEKSNYLIPHVSFISAILLSIILLYSSVPTSSFSFSVPVTRPTTMLAGTIAVTPSAIRWATWAFRVQGSLYPLLR